MVKFSHPNRFSPDDEHFNFIWTLTTKGTNKVCKINRCYRNDTTSVLWAHILWWWMGFIFFSNINNHQASLSEFNTLMADWMMNCTFTLQWGMKMSSNPSPSWWCKQPSSLSLLNDKCSAPVPPNSSLALKTVKHPQRAMVRSLTLHEGPGPTQGHGTTGKQVREEHLLSPW